MNEFLLVINKKHFSVTYDFLRALTVLSAFSNKFYLILINVDREDNPSLKLKFFTFYESLSFVICVVEIPPMLKKRQFFLDVQDKCHQHTWDSKTHCVDVTARYHCENLRINWRAAQMLREDLPEPIKHIYFQAVSNGKK